jgi:hypothetical protein
MRGSKGPILAGLRRRASDPSDKPRLSDLGAAEFELLRRFDFHGEAGTLVEANRSCLAVMSQDALRQEEDRPQQGKQRSNRDSNKPEWQRQQPQDGPKHQDK